MVLYFIHDVKGAAYMASQTPRHLRHEAVASIGSKLYYDLQQALDETTPSATEGNAIVLLSDLRLRERVRFNVSDTVLDLDGHTITLASQLEGSVDTSNRAFLDIQAPDVKIRNGNIICASGAPYAVRIRTAPIQVLTSTAFIERVEIKTKYGSVGIACDSGGVMCTRSTITSTGVGIAMRGPQSRVGLADATVRARRAGVLVRGGKLLAKDSYISAHWSCAIFINAGTVSLSHTSVRAYRERAIATHVTVARSVTGFTSPSIDVRRNSDVCSFPSYAIDLPNGSVCIRDSVVRSTNHTAIRIGTEDMLTEPSLSSYGHAVITSWKADGIHCHSGILRLDDAEFICDRGSEIVYDSKPYDEEDASEDTQAAATSDADGEATTSEDEGSPTEEEASDTEGKVVDDAEHDGADEATPAQTYAASDDNPDAQESPAEPHATTETSEPHESSVDEADTSIPQDAGSEKGEAPDEVSDHDASEHISQDGSPTDESAESPQDEIQDDSQAAEPSPEQPQEEHQDADESPYDPFDARDDDQKSDDDFYTKFNTETMGIYTAIERVDVQHVHTHLHAVRPIRFTGRINTASSHARVEFEQWTNGLDVITSAYTQIPEPGTTYRYVIALRADSGYAFSKRFKLYYRGKRVPYSAVISSDQKTAIASWNLTAEVPELKMTRRRFF